MPCRRFALTALAVVVLVAPGLLPAAELYVNNRSGNDGWNGRSPRPLDDTTGPVKSIRQALRLCNGRDRIIVANTGDPYLETLHLSGEKNSGEPGAELTIFGNGAVVSGLRAVPPEAWRYVGKEVWRMQTHRKGRVMLLLDGEPVPRHVIDKGAKQRPVIPPGSFIVYRGLVYYQGDAEHRPPTMNFAFAYDDVGATLYKVHDVVIRDLNFQHFRLDGVAAPDSAQRITLRNVTSVGNGRAGLSLDGVSSVFLLGGEINGNWEHSVLLRGTAGLGVEGTEFDVDPTVVE